MTGEDSGIGNDEQRTDFGDDDEVRHDREANLTKVYSFQILLRAWVRARYENALLPKWRTAELRMYGTPHKR